MLKMERTTVKKVIKRMLLVVLLNCLFSCFLFGHKKCHQIVLIKKDSALTYKVVTSAGSVASSSFSKNIQTTSINHIFTDWQAMFQTKCYGCQFPIEPGDRWVEALNQNWHSECFNCSVS